MSKPPLVIGQLVRAVLVPPQPTMARVTPVGAAANIAVAVRPVSAPPLAAIPVMAKVAAAVAALLSVHRMPPPVLPTTLHVQLAPVAVTVTPPAAKYKLLPLTVSKPPLVIGQLVRAVLVPPQPTMARVTPVGAAANIAVAVKPVSDHHWQQYQ